jgi:hypothetical protein
MRLSVPFPHASLCSKFERSGEPEATSHLPAVVLGVSGLILLGLRTMDPGELREEEEGTP